MNISNVENWILFNDCILHGRCVKSLEEQQNKNDERKESSPSASGIQLMLHASLYSENILNKPKHVLLITRHLDLKYNPRYSTKLSSERVTHNRWFRLLILLQIFFFTIYLVWRKVESGNFYLSILNVPNCDTVWYIQKIHLCIFLVPSVKWRTLGPK